MEVHHVCGYPLQLLLQPIQYDVTSYGDVPSHFSNSNGTPRVSFDNLPLEYHKFVKVGEIPHWFADQREVSACPACHTLLPHSPIGGIEDVAMCLQSEANE